MNITTFKNLVPRTANDLGSKLSNSIHATLGMGSEIMAELTIAFSKRDAVNIAEELADAQWFACWYALVHGIYVPDSFIIDFPDALSRKNRKIYYDNLRISLGKLQDWDKAELAYNKIKCTPEERMEALYMLFKSIEFIALDRKVDMFQARHRVMDKLAKRFPDKFSYDQANNRNLDAERNALEGGEE
jgi:NTP pyrophosphatase (non-canonical NTP hydrolase)